MKNIILSALLFFAAFSSDAFSAVKTWDGGGADANWLTAANWAGDVTPAANDDLVFPANAAQFSTNNNFFLLTAFRSIKFEGGNYTINGNPLRLTNGLVSDAGTQTIATAISLSAAQTFSVTARDSVVTVAVLSLGGFGLTVEGDGNFVLGLISGSGSITKNGAGATLIASANAYTGAINLNNGILVVDAVVPNSAVTINSPFNGTNFTDLAGFGGTGTVGAVNIVQGVISAGTLQSPTGTLTTGNITFSSNSGYVCKIGGTATGQFDQLNVTGNVALNNALLGIVPWQNFRPAIGDAFVILQNDGTDAINGTFLNLPEGATFVGAFNTAFQITYRGGDGNDIAIKRINRANFDFDGDGKSDISVFRPSNGTWYAFLSGNGGFFSTQFGATEDIVAPADFDGDNRTDTAVFRPSNGVWYILRSSDSAFVSTQFGAQGDIPAPNDFDGDSRADIAVFRPSNGTWYQMRSVGNQFFAQQFGANGDKPLVGDFDGDGIGDLAVFRNDGNWYISRSSDGAVNGLNFGFGSDKAVPADYDGDGKTDVAVYRSAVGTGSVFYYLRSTDGQFVSTQFGLNEDIPTTADYDGDGKSDIAVFRPSNAAWYQLRSTSGFAANVFGLASDKPIPSAYFR